MTRLKFTNAIFRGGWDCEDDVYYSFELTKEDIIFVDAFLYANYDVDGFEGSAHVVFVGVDGDLYEVFGSHCSCFGLEDQWDIEITSVEYYLNRKEIGLKVDDELMEVLLEYQEFVK